MAAGKGPKEVKYKFEINGETKHISLTELGRIIPHLSNFKYTEGTANKIANKLTWNFMYYDKNKQEEIEAFLKEGYDDPKEVFQGYEDEKVDLMLAYFDYTYNPGKVKEIFNDKVKDGSKKDIKTGAMRLQQVIKPITECAEEEIGWKNEAKLGAGSSIEASARAMIDIMTSCQNKELYDNIKGKSHPQSAHKVAMLYEQKKKMETVSEVIDQKVKNGEIDENKAEFLKAKLDKHIEEINSVMKKDSHLSQISGKLRFQTYKFACGIIGGVKNAWKYMFLQWFLITLGNSFGEALYLTYPTKLQHLRKIEKGGKMAVTVIGSIAMLFMLNAEDQRLNQLFGKGKGEKIDMINLVLGAFLSGFLGIFTGVTGIKIYQGEIEDVIGNALINHGKKHLVKPSKRSLEPKSPY